MFLMFHTLLPPNCYIDLIRYLDVDSVTGDGVSRGAYCGEVSLALDWCAAERLVLVVFGDQTGRS